MLVVVMMMVKNDWDANQDCEDTRWGRWWNQEQEEENNTPKSEPWWAMQGKKTEHCNTLQNTSSNLYHLAAATSVKKPGITTICRGVAQSEESFHNRKNIPLRRPLPWKVKCAKTCLNCKQNSGRWGYLSWTTLGQPLKKWSTNSSTARPLPTATESVAASVICVQPSQHKTRHPEAYSIFKSHELQLCGCVKDVKAELCQTILSILCKSL